MPSAIFELFEIIADELGTESSRVLDRISIESNETNDELFEKLRNETGSSSSEAAVTKAIQSLSEHFVLRGSALPFRYDPLTGRFSEVDAEFLAFVRDMREIRSLGKKAADFEKSVLRRLSLKVTGSLHRVGFPRDTKKSVKAFNRYLQSLGFNGSVLFGKEKDGGFDLIWALPLGGHPHRPLVSVQCKNGLFDIGEAHKSVGTGSSSLAQHLGLQTVVHVPCVLFNDYLHTGLLGPKQLNFVPLGLSDLAALSTSITSVLI